MLPEKGEDLPEIEENLRELEPDADTASVLNLKRIDVFRVGKVGHYIFRRLLEKKGYHVRTFDVQGFQSYSPAADDLPDCIIVNWGPHAHVAFDIDRHLRNLGKEVSMIIASSRPPVAGEEVLPESVRAVFRTGDVHEDSFIRTIQDVISTPRPDDPEDRVIWFTQGDR